MGSSKPLSQSDGIGLEPSESLSRGPMLLLKSIALLSVVDFWLVGSGLECVVVQGERRGLFIVWPQKAIVSLCVWPVYGSLRVGRSDCHALSHQGIRASGHQGGRLTVPPDRSDRAVHGGIVGTQRARQDPTKQDWQEHEQEQWQEKL